MALWTPAQLGSKVKLWLKADTLTGLDGSSISTWADSSGNGNTAAAGNSPTLKKALLNGLNIVRFDAASSQSFAFSSSFMSGRTQGAAFVVLKTKADPTLGGSFYSGALLGEWGTDGTASHYPFTNSSIYDDYGTYNRRPIGDPSPALDAWRIASYRVNATNWRFDLDATNVYADAGGDIEFNNYPTGGQTGPASAFNYPQIGRSYGVSVTSWYYFDGDCAEVVDCSEFLTTDEKEKLEGYLAWKWGLQGNLPGAHPYKSSAPKLPVKQRHSRWI